MAPRDFGPLRRLVERRMFDSCTITRDELGTDDDVLDPVTLDLTPPAGDGATIYDGKSLVYPTALSEHTETEGSRAYTEKTYTLRIPWTANEPHVGDVVVINASREDVALVGRPFRVASVDKSSFLTSRDMVVEDRTSP